MPNSLPILIASHKLKCTGVCKDGRPALIEENAALVIVNVFNSGKTRPLCRYYVPGIRDRCNPSLDRGVGTTNVEDNYGICIYSMAPVQE